MAGQVTGAAQAAIEKMFFFEKPKQKTLADFESWASH
jgi:hypothetical protein